ncbi:MAG TPA: hypothetical protein VGM02_08400 [Acidobacteriaceae bacterium]|jgi:hypothetical protein
MNALPNEEPLTTADIANRQRVSRASRDAVVDETDVDPADRRPPQSVAGRNTAVDDTYDGEIVSSSADPTESTASSRAAGRNPDRQSAYESRSESSYAAPSTETVTSAQDVPSTPQTGNGRSESPLFAEDELRDFRARWDQVQTSFVDEPRHAVEQADTLVATVVKRIAEQFSEERAKLEKQWDRGDNVSTEDLRQGFKRYRAFFDRLLAF